MNDYFNKYKVFLNENKLHFIEAENESSKIIMIEYIIPNSPAFEILYEYGNNCNSVGIYIIRYIPLENPPKHVEAFRLVNKLNMDFRFAKFIIDEKGYITIFITIAIIKMFDPEETYCTTIHLINVAKEAFPQFAKLLWT